MIVNSNAPVELELDGGEWKSDPFKLPKGKHKIKYKAYYDNGDGSETIKEDEIEIEIEVPGSIKGSVESPDTPLTPTSSLTGVAEVSGSPVKVEMIVGSSTPAELKLANGKWRSDSFRLPKGTYNVKFRAYYDNGDGTVTVFEDEVSMSVIVPGEIDGDVKSAEELPIPSTELTGIATVKGNPFKVEMKIDNADPVAMILDGGIWKSVPFKLSKGKHEVKFTAYYENGDGTYTTYDDLETVTIVGNEGIAGEILPDDVDLTPSVNLKGNAITKGTPDKVEIKIGSRESQLMDPDGVTAVGETRWKTGSFKLPAGKYHVVFTAYYSDNNGAQSTVTDEVDIEVVSDEPETYKYNVIGVLNEYLGDENTEFQAKATTTEPAEKVDLVVDGTTTVTMKNVSKGYSWYYGTFKLTVGDHILVFVGYFKEPDGTIVTKEDVVEVTVLKGTAVSPTPTPSDKYSIEGSLNQYSGYLDTDFYADAITTQKATRVQLIIDGTSQRVNMNNVGGSIFWDYGSFRLKSGNHTLTFRATFTESDGTVIIREDTVTAAVEDSFANRKSMQVWADQYWGTTDTLFDLFAKTDGIAEMVVVESYSGTTSVKKFALTRSDATGTNWIAVDQKFEVGTHMLTFTATMYDGTILTGNLTLYVEKPTPTATPTPMPTGTDSSGGGTPTPTPAPSSNKTLKVSVSPTSGTTSTKFQVRAETSEAASTVTGKSSIDGADFVFSNSGGSISWDVANKTFPLGLNTITVVAVFPDGTQKVGTVQVTVVDPTPTPAPTQVPTPTSIPYEPPSPPPTQTPVIAVQPTSPPDNGSLLGDDGTPAGAGKPGWKGVGLDKTGEYNNVFGFIGWTIAGIITLLFLYFVKIRITSRD
jgi:hypothetical protein